MTQLTKAQLADRVLDQLSAGRATSGGIIDRVALVITDLIDSLADVTTVATISNLHISGAGAPVDYTDGTPPASGEGTSPKGALYTDSTNGFVYRNSGTLAQPLWTKLADA